MSQLNLEWYLPFVVKKRLRKSKLLLPQLMHKKNALKTEYEPVKRGTGTKSTMNRSDMILSPKLSY